MLSNTSQTFFSGGTTIPSQEIESPAIEEMKRIKEYIFQKKALTTIKKHRSEIFK